MIKKITSLRQMSEYATNARKKGLNIGFVPTMGYLHQGHLSLLKRSVEDCDRTVISIFVNPAQFAPGEDLERYPRDMDRDLELASSEKVDIAFTPSAERMYPKDFATYVDVSDSLTGVLCGHDRTGHFRGVATVVAKLFNIVRPHAAYFGQKDFQQSVIIKRMTEDLNMDVDIEVLPTVRDSDGLAKSSRNSYLTDEERREAPALYKALREAEKGVREGVETDAAKICERVRTRLGKAGFKKIDYVKLVDPKTLEGIDEAKNKCVLLVAAHLGKARLIDNIAINRKDPR